ncbi:MAG TPA: phosphoribosyl-ATP diphosphatase [Patescibacteria group bacterium]|nr:phosphoribosyl-ATP diphosphatase [Patescibacteria group bacterium]
MTVEELYQIIKKRKQEQPEQSYVASLFKKGTDRIVQKVGEEATEVVIAAKNNNSEEVIKEVADLWFHTLVLLAAQGITPEDIFNEFEKRRKS